MSLTLIIYSTTDGQTKAICKRISSVINQTNSTEVVSIDDAGELDLAKYDQIVIGASIRYGKHSPDLYQFIESNISILEANNNIFFSVNAVARKPEKNTPNTNPYMEKFLSLSSWKPALLEVFGGKIDYQKYNFVDKYMIRLIMWMTKGPTDMSEAHEFTNWDKVEEFANQIVILK